MLNGTTLDARSKRILSLKEIPQNAGEVRLRLTNEELWPRRDGGTILFPAQTSMHTLFFPLQGGEQFLLGMFPSMDTYGPQTSGQYYRSLAINADPSVAVWFGGMDERPFLTAMKPKALSMLAQYGENGFYQDLIPPEVKWELKTALKNAGKLKRQGDIHAIPIPCDTDDFARYIREEWDAVDVKERDFQGNGVLDTNHELQNGPLYEFRFATIYSPKLHKVSVGRGTLKAADHKPLELGDLHLLAQTQHLILPEDYVSFKRKYSD